MADVKAEIKELGDKIVAIDGQPIEQQ